MPTWRIGAPRLARIGQRGDECGEADGEQAAAEGRSAPMRDAAFDKIRPRRRGEGESSNPQPKTR